MTHTEVQSFEISQHKNPLEKSQNLFPLPRSLKLVIYQKLEHDAIAVSSLAGSFKLGSKLIISTEINTPTVR